MKHEFFHWPDHVVGKRESRQIREAHNAAMNDYHALLETLQAFMEFLDNGTPIRPGSIVVEQARLVMAKQAGGAK